MSEIREQVLGVEPKGADDVIRAHLRDAAKSLREALRMLNNPKRLYTPDGECAHTNRINVGTYTNPHAWICSDCEASGDE